MNRNLNPKVVAAIVAILVLLAGAGTVVLAGRGGADNVPPGHTEAQGAEITVHVRDQNKDGISGVEVQVIDETGARVDSSTTRGDGEVIVQLGAAAGRYRIVVPNTPDGHVDHSDMDGAVIRQPSCDNPHRCIRYVVDGKGTVTVPDDPNVTDTGSGWFEFTKLSSGIVDDEETFVDPGQGDTSEGSEGADEDNGADDGVSDDTSDEVAEAPERRPVTGSLECEVAHGQSASDILVQVNLEGGDDATRQDILDGRAELQGDSMNSGNPLPGEPGDGVITFEAPIQFYGPHPGQITFYGPDGQMMGSTPFEPSVGPDEGPLEGCEGDFLLGEPGEDVLIGSGDDDLLGDDGGDLLNGSGGDDELFGQSDEEFAQDILGDQLDDRAEEEIHDFAAAFGTAHDARNSEFLVGRLHPTVIEAYGSVACNDHVSSTTGGVTDVSIIEIGDYQTLEFGNQEVDAVRPVTFEWTATATGERQQVQGYVAFHDGEVRWFTGCGMVG